MKLLPLILSFALSFPLAAQLVDPSPIGPIRILCIGDSITQGGKRDREEYTYRYPMFQILTDMGVAFDFIGTRTLGLDPGAKWPDYKGWAFDPHHEGYYGAKTAAVLAKLKKNLPTLPPPDFALVHLGTNDQRSKDLRKAILKPLTEMVSLLRQKNPNVTILIGHLNFNGGVAKKAIRPLVEELKQLSTEESRVDTVRHYLGWKESPLHENTDTFDWAHPNPQGQLKMAKNWIAAMRLLEIQLPRANMSLTSEPLEITVHKDGSTELDGKRMSLDQMAKFLKDIGQADPDKGVLVRSHRQVMFKHVVSVMDLCKKHGIQNVSISTLKE